jgi:hypothetical protein
MKNMNSRAQKKETSDPKKLWESLVSSLFRAKY